jgi:outer membrane receptor protein involved in Fe transport
MRRSIRMWSVLIGGLWITRAEVGRAETCKPSATSADVTTEQMAEMPIGDLLEVQTTVASTKESTVFNTPSSVVVIDRDTIERYNFESVGEAINTLAGFTMWKTSSFPDVPTSRSILQFHYPNKILLMIDGVPAWTPVLGDARIRRIDIEDVERIEVLSGPASVLYGTNAYTGAINVVLRCKPATDGVNGSANAGAGTFAGIRGGGNVTGRDGDLAFFVGAGGYQEDGNVRGAIDSEAIFGHFHDFRNGMTAVMSLEYKQHSVLLNLYRTDVTVMGTDVSFSSGWGNPERAHGYLANYTFSQVLNETFELRAGATFDWGQRVFSRDVAYDQTTSVVGYRAGAFAKSIVTLPADLTLELGIDYENRHSSEYRTFSSFTNATTDNPATPQIDGEGNLRAVNVYETSGYAQAGWKHQGLALLGGTRLTYNENFKTNLSSRATAVYALSNTQSVKLIAGQSYRAPTLFEQYFINVKRTVSGNPTLDPETSASFELAYLASFDGLFGQVLVYHAIYDATIVRIPVGADVILADGMPQPSGKAKQYANARELTANGAEVELVYREGPVAAFASYGYVKGTVPGDAAAPTLPGEDNFTFVPQHKAVVGVSAAYGGGFVSTVGTYLSKMDAPKPADDGGPPVIDAQYKVDVNLGYQHSFKGNRVRHVLSAKNITNQKTEVPDYVDRAVHSIPYDETRRIMYTVSVDF